MYHLFLSLYLIFTVTLFEYIRLITHFTTAAQSIVIQSQVPKGMKKIDFATQMEETLKKYCKEIFLTADDIYEPEKRQPPRFVTQIKDMLELQEMQEAKFDCQLAPVGDPNMKVEWFFNGKPLPYSK